jgi:hypothetical protein
VVEQPERWPGTFANRELGLDFKIAVGLVILAIRTGILVVLSTTEPGIILPVCALTENPSANKEETNAVIRNLWSMKWIEI